MPHASSLHYPGSHGTGIYQRALVKNGLEEEEARSRGGRMREAGRVVLFPLPGCGGPRRPGRGR